MKHIKQIFLIIFILWPALAASMELQQKVGDWTSGFLTNDGGTRIFRAISSNERKSLLNVFFAIDIVSNCKETYSQLLVYIPQGVDESGFLNIGKFQARVDSMPIIKGAWTSSANEMGDNIIFMTLLTHEKFNLIDQMKLGNTLRIKLNLSKEGDNDLYLNFSLKGSSIAINRAQTMCHEFNNTDEKYFYQDNDKKSTIKPEDIKYFL